MNRKNALAVVPLEAGSVNRLHIDVRDVRSAEEMVRQWTEEFHAWCARFLARKDITMLTFAWQCVGRDQRAFKQGNGFYEMTYESPDDVVRMMREKFDHVCTYIERRSKEGEEFSFEARFDMYPEVVRSEKPIAECDETEVEKNGLPK